VTKRDIWSQRDFLVSLRQGEKPEMTALIHALSHAFSADADFDSLQIVAIFSGAGLLVSLLSVLFFLIYGVDLSLGFF
jgi:hypothetical protein